MATIINGGKSTYAQDAIVKHLLGIASFSEVTTPYLALTSDIPTPSSGTELITGTSPNYARVAMTMARISTGLAQNSTVLTFPTPSGNWLQAKGFQVYDASTSGNVIYFGELISNPLIISSVDTSGDTVTSNSHGLSNNQLIMIKTDGNGTIPGGLSATTVYYVVGATTNTIQFSLTQGGSAVDITTVGSGTLRLFLNYYQTANTTSIIQIAANALNFIEQ